MFWWEKKEAEENPHLLVFKYVRDIEQNQQHVFEMNKWHARLYWNREISSLDWRGWSGYGKPLPPVHYNLIQSVIETATSIIAKQRPMPVAMTDGANFELYRQANNISKYLLGVFQHQRVWDKANRSFREACIYGTTGLKVQYDPDSKKICVEKVYADEIIVDERECIGDVTPTQMFHRQIVDKETLKGIYPDYADKIDEAAKPEQERYVSYREHPTSHVVFIEGWRLPVGNTPGKHFIGTSNCTFLYEEYNHDRFPIIVHRWADPPGVGFYGQGIAEQIAGIQLQINRLNEHVDKSMMLAVPHIIAPRSAGIKPEDLTNDEMTYIPYNGGIKPEIWVGDAVSVQVFQRIDSLIESGYRFVGVSQMAATSMKPPGLDSGKAIRESNDIGIDRFAIKIQDYERFLLDIAEVILMVSADAYKNDNPVYTDWMDRNTVKEIYWPEVDLDKNKFTLRLEASSILTKTPAGRQADLADLIRANYLKPEEAIRLLGQPDLEEWEEEKNADREDVAYTIERLLNGEPVDPPENFQNLPLMFDLVQKNYLRAKNKGADESTILMPMRNYLAMVKAALDRIQQEQLAQQQQVIAQQQMLQQPSGTQQ